jgi:putative PIG3 family NAD(P)H quinone oxidoreductase
LKAVLVENPGKESELKLGSAPSPELRPDAIRIAVAATAVNRADLLQRRGLYPPPPGESEILGLECAGEVVEVGAEVEGWQIGDRAMALLAGGGYASEVVVAAGCAMSIPPAFSFEEAAAIPEVFLTVFSNVIQLAALPQGGSVLVHGGGSGIGTAAIQVVKAAGGSVYVTAGSDEKCERCRVLGADGAINYRSEAFEEVIRDLTGGRGVDVILDSIGASYLKKNLSALAVGGRLVVIGLMGGVKAEISLGPLLARRLQIMGSTLRSRPVAEKTALVAAFEQRFRSSLEEGVIRPVIDRVLPLEEVSEAHRVVEASEHFGKVVLRVA